MPVVEARSFDEVRAELEAEQERRRLGETLRVEAQRLQSSLREFIRAAWPMLEPVTRFRSNWHIDAIAEHLEAAYRREILRLVVNIPPRTMKSSTVTVLAPAWRWTTHPHERFLTASYGAELATRDAVKTRRLITSPWYLARWGDVYRLTSDQNVKTRYENDRTGYRIATSVGGAGTGEGGDVIIIDDPHKADEVESDTQREAVLSWHDGTISTRFNDPATGVEILVMQRLHERDLTGHLLTRGGWTHLCLPMEYESTHPFVWPDDPRSQDGELLWDGHLRGDSRFDAAAVASLKRDLGPYRAAGQLQQRPAPAEGGILKRHYWRYYSPAEQPGGVEDWSHVPQWGLLIHGWDTALKDKTQNDFTVGALWGISGGNRYLLREARGQWALSEIKTQLEAMYEWARARWPFTGQTIYVGNAANGPEVVAQMRDRVPGIVSVPEGAGGDKVQRAHAVEPQLAAGNVFVPGAGRLEPDGFLGPDPDRTPGWVMDFVAEHTSFPNAAHDDRVDTTTMVLIRAGVPAEPSVPAAEGNGRDQRELSAGILEQVF